MPKTSSKSVSKAAPKKKAPAKTKRTASANSKVAAAKKTRPTKAQKAKTLSKSTSGSKKSSSTAKKSPVKRTRSTTATTKKATKTKVKAKSTVKQSTKAPATKKAAAQKTTKSATSSSTAKTKQEVVLPTRMSIRAREKALVLADTFEKDFYVPGLTLAKVGGFCFLLIGSLVTYSQLTQVNLIDGSCAAASCNAAQVTSATVSYDTAANQQSFVELLAEVPSVIDEQVGIPMRLSSIKGVKVYLRHFSEGQTATTKLELQSIGNNKFEVTIEPTNLSPDQYELMVSVQETSNTQMTVYSLGYFAILGDVVAGSNNTQAEPKRDVARGEATTTSTTANLREAATSTSSEQASTTEGITTPRENPDQTPPSEQSANNNVLQITTASTLSDIATVRVANAHPRALVSFDIRPQQTLNTQSIGQMIPGTGIFKFDTTQFPNGRYQLSAEHRVQGAASTSNIVGFVIQNEPVAAPARSLATSSTRELYDVASEYSEPLLDESVAGSSTLTRANFDQRQRARAALAADSEALGALFQRYAVAVQSGDPTLLAEADRTIQTYRQSLVTSALNNERDRLFATELDTGLTQELQSLTRKVQTFEVVRKERTESDSAIDTDGDGIADFDEVNLYNTDPTLADTDNDGFTDGAEIIKGFNPIDAAAEVSIVYQSPKESVGVVRTDKLQVAEVVPEIELPAGNASKSVRAVVRGIGLPNSYVTLYLYSTPTIVTVRTEADGSFEYTFSKELADGQHEVFVALTDNTGAIIAQSNDYAFVKEAQAFTPVDAQEVVATSATADAANQASPYRLVLGMSVLALGILLILLGIGLRSNKPEIMIVEDKPV